MINVSSAFREALENDNRAYVERVVLTLEDETVLELGNAELWDSGYEVEDSVSSDDSFSALGSAIVNSATLVINNIYDDFSEYVFENAKAVLYIGLELEDEGQTAVESVKRGTYIVDETKYNGSIITLSLLDYMYFFDRPYSDSTLTYPASCDTIIRDACTICGINLASTTFPNRDTVIAERPADEAITFREVIAYVAQICGCYARCNADGALELKWFDTASLEDETANVYHIDSVYSSDVSMDDVVITGVRATYNVTIDDKEETLTYLSGTEGYVIEIENNPMITGLTVQNIVNRLGTQLIGLRFRKANVSHSSDPTLEAGDVAILDDQKGNSYPLLITRTRFKVGSAQNTVCGAETPARKSAARYSEETKNYVELRKKINYQKDAFDAAIEDLSERIDAADGMFTTQETTPGGGTITYLHNKPLLSESDIQIMISSVGVTVTSNGTDPEPTWYGLTVDGTLISNILNTVGINASWIDTGQLVIRKNGQEVFFADVDTGTVRISGNSISITAGDPISTAISAAEQSANSYTDQHVETARGYTLETPFTWANNNQTANFTAIIYKGEDDVTSDYPNSWFVWTLRTENGESQIATGKTCSVAKSALGYGGTVTCTFTTYETATLATRSLKALNTRSGLTLTTYVATEGTQPVTELPYKTATEVNLNDYLMGIDAADGYQVSVQDLANRLATSIYDAKYASILNVYTKTESDARYADISNVYTKAETDARYVNIDGDTMTGSLTAISLIRKHPFTIGTVPSSNSYTMSVQGKDSANTEVYGLYGIYTTDDKLGTQLEVARTVNGTRITNNFRLFIDANGDRSVTVSDSAIWRSAIGAVNKAGDTMTGALTISVARNASYKTKFTDIDARIGQTAPSSTIYWDKSYVLDKNNRLMHFEEGAWGTNNNFILTYGLRRYSADGNSNYTNYFYLGIDNSGNYSVHLSAPNAWLDALGFIPPIAVSNLTLSLVNCTGTISGQFYLSVSSNHKFIQVYGRVRIKSFVRTSNNPGVYVTLPFTPSAGRGVPIGYRGESPVEQVNFTITANSTRAILNTTETYTNAANGTLTLMVPYTIVEIA